MTANRPKVVRTKLPESVHQESNDLPSTRTEESEESIQMNHPTAETDAPWWIALLPSRSRPLIAILFCLGALGLVSVSITATLSLSSSNSSPPSAQNQVISRTDYELLKLGMTTTDAQANIGRGTEVRNDGATIVYKWTNGDGSHITAAFKNGRLVSKEQSGLR